MSPLALIIAVVVGYLLGSISWAVLIAKRKGIDIFSVGSGNPGATNVKRMIGRREGNLCFLLDAVKGAVAAGWPLLLHPDPATATLMAVLGLAAAILGHSYSIFIRFRGGKGVATTIGGLLVIAPMVTMIGLVLWVAVFYFSGYVALASLLFGASLPLTAWWLNAPPPVLLLCLVLAVIIWVRHRSNLARLRDGTEFRYRR